MLPWAGKSDTPSKCRPCSVMAQRVDCGVSPAELTAIKFSRCNTSSARCVDETCMAVALAMSSGLESVKKARRDGLRGASLRNGLKSAASVQAAAFAGRFGPEVVQRSTEGDGPLRIDLWAATARALREVGISPGQIVNPRICTACNTDLFYSHRVEGPETGRHGCLGWVASS